MGDKAYIVTSGEYSDYHICAVFLDKSTAEEYVKRFNSSEGCYDAAGISEWDILSEVPHVVVVYNKAWRPLPGGERSWTFTTWSHEWNGDNRPIVGEYSKDGFRVYGTDETAVNKCFSDRLVKFRSERGE